MKRGTLFVGLLGCACAFESGAGQGDGGTTDGSETTAGPGTTDGPSTTAATTQSSSAGTEGLDGTGSATTLEPETESTSNGTNSTTSSGDETAGPGDTSSSSSTGGGDPYVLCDDSDPDLRACYDFADVGDGTLTDLSSQGNDGVVGDVGVEAGPFGGAVRTSGSEEIAVDDSPSLDIPNTLTFEAWVWLDSVPQSGDRYGVLDNDGQYSLILYPQNGFRCDGGSVSAFTGEVPLEQWMHVACVYDGDTMTAWVDGVLVATEAGGGAVNVDNGDPISIGDGSPDFDEPLDGLVAAVRVWSVVRTEGEIVAAAAAG